MRILLVNKYHYLRGGDCTHVFSLANLLKEHGNEVRHFSMNHPKNLDYPYKKDFVTHIDFKEELKKGGVKSRMKSFARILYSKEARLKFRRVLESYKPDIIHFHNIHKHLTTSILLEANKQDIPVVWTLHDYNLICPNISFVSKDKICERCKRQGAFAPILEKCSNNSLSASSVIAFEKMLHNIQGVKRRVLFFIAPSEFLKKKFIEYKYDREKIKVFPNFFRIKKHDAPHNFKDKYYLFLGRLSPEKGIRTLCEAASRARIRLVIAGEGPLKESLERKYKEISFIGYKTGKELEELRRNAWFVVVPSEWYENNPFSIIESFADKVPVIAADIGGIPELVVDKKTGFLFESRNTKQLAGILSKTSRMSILKRNQLGMNGKELVNKKNNPEKYYQELINLYRLAIAKVN